jgi:hypothetical protein
VVDLNPGVLNGELRMLRREHIGEAGEVHRNVTIPGEEYKRAWKDGTDDTWMVAIGR